MSLDFEAKADLGMNCGCGAYSLCDLGQLLFNLFKPLIGHLNNGFLGGVKITYS